MAAFELDADREIFRLPRELRSGAFRPSAWRLRVVQDPKIRLIAAPAVRDRVVHRSLLDEIGPHFERRYIDDFVLFDQDPERWDRARKAIAQWLDEERDLRLKPDHQKVLSTRAPALFLGYRITRAGIAPSRKLRRRLKRRLALAVAGGEEALQRTLASYRGLLLFPD